jgi:lipopolysaccharide export system permease protein
MRLVEGYIFKTTFWSFAAALGVLTLMIWITQALREVDLLTTKGQSLLIFLGVTSLTVPSLVMIIAPIALFIAVLYSLNRLNSDSELIVMTASGVSPFRLIRPFVGLTLLVGALVALMSLYLMPWSFHKLRDMVTQVRADFLTRVVREGTFTTLDQGFVFHYRERGPNGELLGVFMQDRRDPQRVNTYLAEKGQTLEAGDSNYLVLEKGSVQRQQAGSRDPNMVAFDRYAIDLAQFDPDDSDTAYKPRERSTMELLRLNKQDPYVQRQLGRFRAELHDRLVNPLYAVTFGLIAFAALGQARTTRQGRGTAILGAVVFAALVRVAGFAASNYVARTPVATAFVYLVPLIGIAAALAYMFGFQDWLRGFGRMQSARAPEPQAA